MPGLSNISLCDFYYVSVNLELEIFKTLAAFMNSNEGILLVGVEDDGTISGIEKDFETSDDRKNWDGWLQHLTNLIDRQERDVKLTVKNYKHQ